MNAYYTNQYISTTLATVGGIDDTQTTGIIIASVTNIETAKPGIACISYTDPVDTSKAEWITYTSIDSVTKEFQGVTRGQEGYGAKPHDNGVTIAFPLSKSHINNLNDALIIDGSATNLATGVIDDDTFATASATKLATSESTKAYVDNGTWLKDSMSRQAIINGNFDVWQRGTGLTLTDSTLYYLADRWSDFVSKDGGTLPTVTTGREALTPGEIPGSFYAKNIATNGAGTSLGVNSYHQISQNIEHGTRYLCGLGKTVTLSFWAKSTVANKKLGYYAVQSYGTGGSPSTAEVIVGNNVTLTSTWTKYTITFTTNTLTGKTFGTANDDYLAIRFSPMWGASSPTATGVNSAGVAETYVGSGTTHIAQVQLCAGDVALPFMPKSFEEELRACQRYYYRVVTGVSPFANGFLNTTTNARGSITLPVTMRTIPTLETSTITAANFRALSNNAFINISAITDAGSQVNNFNFSITTDAGTANAGCQFECNDANGYIGLTAEL